MFFSDFAKQKDHFTNTNSLLKTHYTKSQIVEWNACRKKLMSKEESNNIVHLQVGQFKQFT